ncbi:hypothetical protein NDU88_007104 [Pleurodeles waltl]|uniref:Uncharacterized protein n=1 Tax=Pleurodeles waltl TaxID=8319 RepID=A0AAV7NS96_PLEWA|nr:hypothetical protein NDU88_007104 [Pleurodeles waltl]
MGWTVIKCQKGLTGEDFSTVNPDKTSEKRKKNKSVSRARAMFWDYTGTQQLQHNPDNVFEGPADPVPGSVGDGAPHSLHLIYQTMITQHKQIQGDNKKARVATKQLQVAVSKIAKTCSEIGERIATIETRASVLEVELGTVAQQSAMHETQLTDIQWKIEDLENWQRHNSLCILGIQRRSRRPGPKGFYS